MRTYLAATVAYFVFSIIPGTSLLGQREKAWIEFDRLDLRSDGEKWMVITMQITPKEHPNEEGALNKYFIDDVKVDLYLCFKNITKEKKLFKETKRKAAIKDVLDYYHAEVEILTMDLRARTKTLVFLLPLEIAKRDGFDTVQNPYGQVVDISIGGVSIQKALKENAKGRLSAPIIFENYRDDSILESFQKEAIANSARTEGILLPAHIVTDAYLRNAPALKFPKPSN